MFFFARRQHSGGFFFLSLQLAGRKPSFNNRSSSLLGIRTNLDPTLTLAMRRSRTHFRPVDSLMASASQKVFIRRSSLSGMLSIVFFFN